MSPALEVCQAEGLVQSAGGQIFRDPQVVLEPCEHHARENKCPWHGGPRHSDTEDRQNMKGSVPFSNTLTPLVVFSRVFENFYI
jgi:hypothetical protein